MFSHDYMNPYTVFNCILFSCYTGSLYYIDITRYHEEAGMPHILDIALSDLDTLITVNELAFGIFY